MPSIVKFETLSKCKVDQNWGQIYITKEDQGNYTNGKIILTIKGPGSEICVNVGLAGLYTINNCIKKAIDIITHNTNEESTILDEHFPKSSLKDLSKIGNPELSSNSLQLIGDSPSDVEANLKE
jgi:hypothetical protein